MTWRPTGERIGSARAHRRARRLAGDQGPAEDEASGDRQDLGVDHRRRRLGARNRLRRQRSRVAALACSALAPGVRPERESSGFSHIPPGYSPSAILWAGAYQDPPTDSRPCTRSRPSTIRTCEAVTPLTPPGGVAALTAE